MLTELAIVLKIALIGDNKTGKKSIINKYVNDTYNISNHNNNSLHYDFYHKMMTVKSVDVILCIWYINVKNKQDSSFQTILKSICNDLKVCIFTFDLTSKKSLLSIKQWYKYTRHYNKVKNTH